MCNIGGNVENIENVFSRIIMESIYESIMVGATEMVVSRYILPRLKEAELDIVRSSNTAHNSEYKSPSAQLKKLAENQKSLTPEMVQVINENFWELF